MGYKSTLIKPFAKKIARNISKWSKEAPAAQEKVFQYLLKNAKKTAFGKDHQFDSIHSYEAFKANVPIRDYEGIKNYIERIKNCLLYTSPSPRDATLSRMPSSA